MSAEAPRQDAEEDGNYTCPTECVETNHPGMEHEQWLSPEDEAKVMRAVKAVFRQRDHHLRCYQNTGVPDDLPANLCDCRVLRMIDEHVTPAGVDR